MKVHSPSLATLTLLALFVSSTDADDSSRLRATFDQAKENSTVTISPGDYHLDGAKPIELKSNLTIHAYGARFHLPESLEDQARIVLFSGANIRNFRWYGGHFEGHVFDPSRSHNSWPPNANTRAIVITTTVYGETNNLTFQDVSSNGLAGAAVTVLGEAKKGSERDIDQFAHNVTIHNCTFERTGKFMWDYGYLWQIMIWPEEFSEAERAMAAKYFRNDLIRTGVTIKSDDDRVYFPNATLLPRSQRRVGMEAERGYDTICFFGADLPKEITKGRQYFVVDSQPEFIRVSGTVDGPPIRFSQDSSANTKLITNLFQAHLALYAPHGSGPGKGAVDLVGCKNVIVQGCRLSALGDTMHIQKCESIAFNGNHITGSRMGAFFLAEYCKNASITGNTVDGTNGSRIVSVEKSCQDVVITGNTFRGGGRGSWINQPRNFVLSNNIFVNNTTKCQRDPKLGRRTFLTGDYEQYPELYFTTYEPSGAYENVIVEGNLFISGPNASHAIMFAPGGIGLLVHNNTFSGPIRSIPETKGCSQVSIRNNEGLLTEIRNAQTDAVDTLPKVNR